ncbi:MAG: hypothetical protein EB059_00700 [Alphaproteobacteria bacterium]|nr:hypothetical protein [Alphaproteobacteria bacterium]
MTKILEKLYPALALGILLALAAVYGLHNHLMNDAAQFALLHINFAVWLHVISGILWIGLLWYFNFVQIPTMPKIPAELKPAVGKFIAPEALFWFRWSALATVITGLLVAYLKGYLVTALSFEGNITIGIGMWLALIMAANVWFIIWPNQKKALGIVVVDDATKAKAARIAMLGSRTNFVLSLPMLYCMVSQNIAG